MQVDITPLNSASKDITLTVEAEKAQAAYRKYLGKSAAEVSVPGFRKGKAPMHLVERNYGSKIRDYFYKDFADEVFEEAAQEHDIHYLLYPEIKDIQWEPGQPFVMQVRIETEPEVSFTQIEGLSVPYKPLDLQAEVENYIREMQQENSTQLEVDDEIREDDEVEFEASAFLDGVSETVVHTDVINKRRDPEIAEAVIGKKIGDSFTLTLPHTSVHRIFKEIPHSNHGETDEVTLMVNSIRRTHLPEIDDAFAKDLEFDSLEDMHIKIEDELRDKTNLKNRNIMINYLISKLYMDNKFDLPKQTIDYLVQKELEQYNVTDTQWRQYYEYQVRLHIIQDFVNMYLMKALRRDKHIEITEAEIEQYIQHEARLSDQNLEAWKEKHKKEMEDEEFPVTVENFTILNRIADTCDFYIQPEETKTGTEIAEDVTDSEENTKQE